MFAVPAPLSVPIPHNLESLKMRSIMLSFAGATVVATSAGAAVTGVTTVS